MAIAVVLDFEGAKLAQYDEVIDLMGFEPQGKGAPGGIFHWVTETANGIRVTDVWESQDLFQKFAEEQIGPFTQKVGITSPPTVSFYEVHNYLTKG